MFFQKWLKKIGLGRTSGRRQSRQLQTRTTLAVDSLEDRVVLSAAMNGLDLGDQVSASVHNVENSEPLETISIEFPGTEQGTAVGNLIDIQATVFTFSSEPHHQSCEELKDVAKVLQAALTPDPSTITNLEGTDLELELIIQELTGLFNNLENSIVPPSTIPALSQDLKGESARNISGHEYDPVTDPEEYDKYIKLLEELNTRIDDVASQVTNMLVYNKFDGIISENFSSTDYSVPGNPSEVTQ